MYPVTAINRSAITYKDSTWKNVKSRGTPEGYTAVQWKAAKEAFNAKSITTPTSSSSQNISAVATKRIELLLISLLVGWRAYKHRGLIAGTDERIEKALASLAWYDRNLVKLMRGLISPFKKTA